MAVPSRRLRIALLAIANHYILTHHITRSELATRTGIPAAKEERKSVDNFFQQAAERNSDKIYEFLKNEVANSSYYDAAPSHIKAAIEEAYSFKTEANRLFAVDS